MEYKLTMDMEESKGLKFETKLMHRKSKKCLDKGFAEVISNIEGHVSMAFIGLHHNADSRYITAALQINGL